MKNIFLLAMAILGCCSCHHVTGSGHVITEKRSTGDFVGISASSGIEVELKNGTTSIEVEADDNIIRLLKTEVKDNILKIYISNHSNVNDAHMKVFVSAAGIRALNASSGSEIHAVDILSGADNISFDASSAGKITADVDAPSVRLESSSAGDIQVKGKTKNLTASCSSSGQIQATGLLSEVTTVEARVGAEAEVHASVSLNADASSGANIGYRGGGNVVVKTSSGGTVNKKD